MIRFSQEYWLLLLVVVPLAAWLAWRSEATMPGIPLSSFRHLQTSVLHRAAFIPVLIWSLRLTAIIALVVAVARPQAGVQWVEQKHFGVDIMLALDISGSMRAEDFQPENRLVAAKQVIGNFIGKSAGHRVGLVAFAGRALTIAPLTTDHDMLRETLARVDFHTVQQDGTAIGDAIGNAIYRLNERNSKGRVLVLFTDGENNAGYLDPIKAAGMAKVKNIRIHTIAVGRPGGAPIPLQNAFGEKIYLRDSDGRLILPQINEESLVRIAGITGGQYFRATDTRGLWAVYDAINRMEHSEIKVTREVSFEERYAYAAWFAVALLLLLSSLMSGRFRILEGRT
ncbi:MAG: VWA domain-containing protein [Candidatus Sericytochromatia bacterium]|nr:VWA domain-containing protein [Candidatus Sericytochromatia bacterium]